MCGINRVRIFHSNKMRKQRTVLISKKIHAHLIGIDEAGRGPLAGPVVVGGIRINSKFPSPNSKFWRGIKDSKRLSAKQREAWFRKLTSHPSIRWAVARISPQVIDRVNIARATHIGARRVYVKLAGNTHCHALLDGSLKLPPTVSHDIHIKGDERFPIISAASIIAKVIRDRIMMRLHRKYPLYGFDRHKGYGTAAHITAIRVYGRSGVHRNSFEIHEPSRALANRHNL